MAEVAPADTGDRRIVGVLTFEGSSEHGPALSRAMSASLRRRGHWTRGGRSLQQVKDELGCMDYEVPCMSRAAGLFASDLVLYGTLRAQGDDHRLEVFLLDAGQRRVQAHVSTAIPGYDLSDATIATTAEHLVQQLWPDGVAAAVVPPAPRGEADEGPKTWIWGYHRGKTPKWKWGTWGSSIGQTVLGAVMTGVGLSAVRPGGPLERELQSAAANSTSDGIDGNDVDPAQGGDLCARAMAEPQGMPGKVTNRAVSQVCRDAEIYTSVANAGIGVMVVGLVGVAVFTTLLYGHRAPAGTRARLRPTRDGFVLRF